MTNIGINGAGVIGRRMADAIKLQPDMNLIGVIKIKPDYKARIIQDKGINIYGADSEANLKMKKAGIDSKGTAEDLVNNVDIMIDATPENIGAKYKPIYENSKCKAIFQGGEEHKLTNTSFVAQCNFDESLGKEFVRTVSCNTTALCRSLNSINELSRINKARVVIARRATDPEDNKKGPIDAISLDPITIPSHHGPDVNTVLPNINITSMAYKIPTTHMHLHSVILTLDNIIEKEEIIKKLEETTRILLVNSADGFKSTSQILDYGRELGRNRSDIYEAIIWKDSINLIENELYFYMGVHQESIVVPENVDAVRALQGKITANDSIKITNETLGIK